MPCPEGVFVGLTCSVPPLVDFRDPPDRALRQRAGGRRRETLRRGAIGSDGGRAVAERLGTLSVAQRREPRGVASRELRDVGSVPLAGESVVVLFEGEAGQCHERPRLVPI